VARLLRTLDSRRRKAILQGKKPSQMDERYAKRAEERDRVKHGMTTNG